MNKKVIYIIISAAIITLVCGIIIYVRNQSGLLTISVYPSDTSFSISSKPYTGGIKNISLTAGTYNLVFTRPGFLDSTQILTVKGGRENNFDIILTPKTVSQDFSSLSEEDKIQSADDVATEYDAAQFLKNYPLAIYAPYNGDRFGVDYKARNEEDTNPPVIITLYPSEILTENQLKSAALTWIKSKGINPSTLTISYTISSE